MQNGMSEAAIRDHEIQKNSDMIDFCTTTYSSIRNREYCIDVSPSRLASRARLPFLAHPSCTAPCGKVDAGCGAVPGSWSVNSCLRLRISPHCPHGALGVEGCGLL